MQKMPYFEGQTRTQPRAQRTVADLFEATAQLLDTGEPERLTTNHIAARAGYSIGTLYRYFPSKLALLRAMALREIVAKETEVWAALKGLSSAGHAEDAVRILVRAALHPFAGRHRVHAGVMRLLAAVAKPDAASVARTRDTPQRVIEVAPSAVLPGITNEMKFTAIHAVTGVIEAALRSRPELITSRDFEDQLVSLVLHLFNDKPDAH
jgi:AcrR family transcriptional regulator